MQKLADGTAQAAAGAKSASEGSAELAGHVASLADGTSQLADGAKQLHSGASGMTLGGLLPWVIAVALILAALCVASVAYQKRLEPVLTEALAGADGKTLLRWTQAILPALKGEPHARARAVVEGRLDLLQKPIAQPIADFLGIKLRPRPR